MTPTPLIIDTDPGVDDVLALLLALASPDEVCVKAITLTFGNTTLDHAYANVLRTGAVLSKHMADPRVSNASKQKFRNFSPSRDPILVASGASKPLGGKMFTASYFHGRDGLSGIHWLPHDPFPIPASPTSPLKPTEEHAADVILDILRENKANTVRIAALGPLTNLAIAFRKDPEAFARVGGISIMGGAMAVCGNTSPCAEFNWYADPTSVQVLVEEAPNHPVMQGRRLPLHVLPLDITSSHTVPYSRLVKQGADLDTANVLERFISAFLTQPRSFTNNMVAPEEFKPDQHDLFQAHDPLAIAHAIFVPVGGPIPTTDGWKHTSQCFQIETSGDLTRGFCVIDRRQSSRNRRVGENRAEDALKKSNDHAHRNLDSYEHERSTAGANGTYVSQSGWIDQVTGTPGKDWFANMFLERLGL